MPTEYTCPGCGSSVLVPNVADVHITWDEQIGCNNTDEHEDGKSLVMWPEDVWPEDEDYEVGGNAPEGWRL